MQPSHFWVQVRTVWTILVLYPTLHPSVIGPIVGGFVAENSRLGWHFNFWLMLILSFLTLVVGYFFTPETVRLPYFEA